jgi:predicted MFS family arabinose efflux permease
MSGTRQGPPALDGTSQGPSRPLVLVLALACGIGVANIYFPQAITPQIGTSLHISAASAALVATMAQIGYACGIFLLVPLGDRVQHRALISVLFLITGVGLLAAGLATALPLLLVLSALVGATTVVPQIIIPMAAGLVSAERRGALTGNLLSGLIGGILLARVFSGTLGDWLGWRAPYLIAAVLALGCGIVMRSVLPVTVPSSRQRYPALLGESVKLFRAEPELRRSCLYQALVFAGFSAAWTSLTLLVTGSRYHLGTPAVGLIALVGAGSVFCTPIAGRAIDRRGSDTVNLICFGGTVAAALILLAGGHGGGLGLVTLTLGMLLMDIAMQCGQVANQARIFALRPEARSRLNTAYMTCAFAGGSLGSWLGVRAYAHFGWNGVCALLGIAALVALTRHAAHAVAKQRAANVGAGTEAEERIAADSGQPVT